MAKLNMRRTINNTKGKINPYYDMTIENLKEISTANRDLFYVISDSFRFGYAQGMKAAKAEMRKRGITA